jgi:hypothetical protein
MALEREESDWGVRLTARPFATGANAALVIKAEIAAYKPGKGAEVRITFPGTAAGRPLLLLDAQAWHEGMTATINEIRRTIAAMKAAAEKEVPDKKSAPAKKKR